MSETDNRLVNWLLSDDRGVSSETIANILSGVKQKSRWLLNVPVDAADFGRCYRLLKIFPEWESRLWEITAIYPKWGPLVDNWQTLTTMYEMGQRAELYDKLHELVWSKS